MLHFKTSETMISSLGSGSFRILVVLTLITAAVSNCKQNPRDQQETKKSESPVQGQQEKTTDEALPRLVVQGGNSRDLGKVQEGVQTNVSFTIVNQGKADAMNISVHDLSKGGCTAVSQVSRLSSGDSATLRFRFETLGYGGKEETRKIRIRYGNPRHSPLTFQVHARVLPAEAHQVPIGELYYNFFVLVDVRDRRAFESGHIAGAIHVPPDDLISWASRLPKDFLIYLYSRDGKKSDKLAQMLREEGYTEALSIIGGIREWKRRYGERVIIRGER